VADERDEGAGEHGPGARPDAGPFTLANALTVARLFAAPLFLALYVAGSHQRALLVYAAAALTDFVDGLVARLMRQHSRLGEILDPLADKLLAFCALVALATAGRIPVWLPILVVGRDVTLVLGALLLQTVGMASQVRVEPTRAGKYATFLLVALVVGALLGDLDPASRTALVPWLAATGLLAASAVVISLVQYGVVFVRTVVRGRAHETR
jgi:cardiolipin synthase